MRHRVRQVQKERFVFVGFNERDRFIGVSPRNGSLIDWQFNNFFITNQRSIPTSNRCLLVEPQRVTGLFRLPFIIWMVHIVGIRNPKIGIESIGSWKRLRMMTEVPFPNTRRRVSGRLELIRDRVFIRIEPVVRLRKQNVLVHPDSLWIATC